MAEDISLAEKALERRTRIAIFGGLPKAPVGRRTVQGRIFNRRNVAKAAVTRTGTSTVAPPDTGATSGVSLVEFISDDTGE